MKTYSIWLIPEHNSRVRYRNLILKIAKKLKSQPFEPHCTVYGRLKLDLQKIEHVIDKLNANQTQFSMKIKKIKNGKNFWKSVYVALEKNIDSDNIFNICKKSFRANSRYSFDPHLSLVYGLHNDEAIYYALRNIEVPRYLSFSGIAIVETGEDISKWQTVYQRQFL